MKSTLLTSFLALMVSCGGDKNTRSDTYDDGTAVAIPEQLTDSHTTLSIKLEIDRNYCGQIRAAMNEWIEQLPEDSREDLRNQVLIIHEPYYLTDAM